MRFEETVDINAPAERVWEVMAAVERWPEWTASVSRVEALDGAAIEQGARFRVKQPRYPRVTWKVTSVEAGRSFTWEAPTFGGHTVASHAIEPAGEGVRVRLVVEQKGPLMRVFGPLTARTTRRYMAMEAQGLKKRSEEPAG
jgi:uncharacterized protein YndB with AHSA1/START domain